VTALLALVPGAVKSDCARSGDVLLDGSYIEVKTTADTTVAQVRAVKYIPLVVHQTTRDEWYVISPDQVVLLVADKPRGQHTENAFECAMLSCPKPTSRHWDAWQKWRVDPERLDEAIRAALLRGLGAKDLRRLMHEQLEQARAIYSEGRAQLLRLASAQASA
jgi:hypothetical protein